MRSYFVLPILAFFLALAPAARATEYGTTFVYTYEDSNLDEPWDASFSFSSMPFSLIVECLDDQVGRCRQVSGNIHGFNGLFYNPDVLNSQDTLVDVTEAANGTMSGEIQNLTDTFDYTITGSGYSWSGSVSADAPDGNCTPCLFTGYFVTTPLPAPEPSALILLASPLALLWARRWF